MRDYTEYSHNDNHEVHIHHTVNAYVTVLHCIILGVYVYECRGYEYLLALPVPLHLPTVGYFPEMLLPLHSGGRPR